MELFDVADNKQHLKELIIDLMDHPYVDNNILDRRKKVFKSFFNDLDGVSLNHYVNIITNVATDGKNIKHNVN
jgi:hypothetical protein